MYGGEYALVSQSTWNVHWFGWPHSSAVFWNQVCYSEVFITAAAQHQRGSSYLSTAPLKIQPPKQLTSLLFPITKVIGNPCPAESNTYSKIIKFCGILVKAKENLKSCWFWTLHLTVSSINFSIRYLVWHFVHHVTPITFCTFYVCNFHRNIKT